MIMNSFERVPVSHVSCMDSCIGIEKYAEACRFLEATKAAEPLLEVIEKQKDVMQNASSRAYAHLSVRAHSDPISYEEGVKRGIDIAFESFCWAYNRHLTSSSQVVEKYKKETLGE